MAIALPSEAPAELHGAEVLDLRAEQHGGEVVERR